MVATTRAPGASLKAPFASNCLSPFTIRPNSKSVEAGLPNQLPEAWGAGGRAFESLRAQSTQQREATAAPRPIRYERPGVVVVIETNGMRRARPWGLLGDSSIASARCWRIWQPSPKTAFRPSSKVSRASTCSPRQRLRSFGGLLSPEANFASRPLAACRARAKRTSADFAVRPWMVYPQNRAKLRFRLLRERWNEVPALPARESTRAEILR